MDSTDKQIHWKLKWCLMGRSVINITANLAFLRDGWSDSCSLKKLRVIHDPGTLSGIQGAHDGIGLVGSLVVRSIHVAQRDDGQQSTSQVPIVPLHTIFVHHIRAAGEAAGSEW